METKSRTKMYVSLPITGRPLSEARRHADLAKAALSRNGCEVVTPFDLYHGKGHDYSDRLCDGLRTMLDCDAVCFCKGWEDSCGCRIAYETVMRFKAHGVKDFKIIFE